MYFSNLNYFQLLEDKFVCYYLLMSGTMNIWFFKKIVWCHSGDAAGPPLHLPFDKGSCGRRPGCSFFLPMQQVNKWSNNNTAGDLSRFSPQLTWFFFGETLQVDPIFSEQNAGFLKGGGSPQLYYNDCSGRIPGHTTRAPLKLSST